MIGINRTIMTLHTIAVVFQVHLKGYSHALNSKNPVSAISAKKRGNLCLNKELVTKEIVEIPRIVDARSRLRISPRIESKIEKVASIM